MYCKDQLQKNIFKLGDYRIVIINKNKIAAVPPSQAEAKQIKSVGAKLQFPSIRE